MGKTVNLPSGTKCELNGDYIFHDMTPLVTDTSNDAHVYFSRDDDGKGLLRGKLTQRIVQELSNVQLPAHPTPLQRKSAAAKRKAWDRIWADLSLRKFKRIEYADHWYWNHAFYNAEIADLEYILQIIEEAKKCIAS